MSTQTQQNLWLFARRCVEAGYDLARAHDAEIAANPGATFSFEHISAELDAKAAHIEKHHHPAHSQPSEVPSGPDLVSSPVDSRTPESAGTPPDNRFAHWSSDLLVEQLRDLAGTVFEQGSDSDLKIRAAADRLEALYFSTDCICHPSAPTGGAPLPSPSETPGNSIHWDDASAELKAGILERNIDQLHELGMRIGSGPADWMDETDVKITDEAEWLLGLLLRDLRRRVSPSPAPAPEDRTATELANELRDARKVLLALHEEVRHERLGKFGDVIEPHLVNVAKWHERYHTQFELCGGSSPSETPTTPALKAASLNDAQRAMQTVEHMVNLGHTKREAMRRALCEFGSSSSSAETPRCKVCKNEMKLGDGPEVCFDCVADARREVEYRPSSAPEVQS